MIAMLITHETIHSTWCKHGRLYFFRHFHIPSLLHYRKRHEHLFKIFVHAHSCFILQFVTAIFYQSQYDNSMSCFHLFYRCFKNLHPYPIKNIHALSDKIKFSCKPYCQTISMRQYFPIEYQQYSCGFCLQANSTTEFSAIQK